MTRSKRSPAWQMRTGTPLEIDGITVTPVSRRLLLRRPQGGFVWQFPVAVVIGQDDEETWLPIPDPTRMIWFALMGGMLLTLFLMALVYARRRSQYETRSKTL